MKAKLLELLARHGAGPAAMGELTKKVEAASAELVSLLGALDVEVRLTALELIAEEVAGRLAAPPGSANGAADGKLPPELREWARQQFNEEEFRAGVREIEATGGLKLDDFIQELEQEATPRE